MIQGEDSRANLKQIISNLVLLTFGSILVVLQHLLYGPLRPIEIEQLYEKAWFAVTETCLAMTIFREELGVWFVVMFVSLLVGKVWGWIGEGRVEILEQQPPANPQLFHARLSSSLILSLLFDIYLLNYTISTVRQQETPSMMVMFAFEFALLNVTALSTIFRYGISVREWLIIRDQTNTQLQERRREIERQREMAATAATEAGEPAPVEPPIEEMLDEADIDAPGWEEKSRWVFYLDLVTGK
jgi:E3 ubiquitin-protein ligase synoviolin